MYCRKRSTVRSYSICNRLELYFIPISYIYTSSSRYSIIINSSTNIIHHTSFILQMNKNIFMVLALLVLVSFAQDKITTTPDNQDKTNSVASDPKTDATKPADSNPAPNGSDPKADATKPVDSSPAPNASDPKADATKPADSNSAPDASDPKTKTTKPTAPVNAAKSGKTANAPKNTKTASPNNSAKAADTKKTNTKTTKSASATEPNKTANPPKTATPVDATKSSKDTNASSTAQPAKDTDDTNTANTTPATNGDKGTAVAAASTSDNSADGGSGSATISNRHVEVLSARNIAVPTALAAIGVLALLF